MEWEGENELVKIEDDYWYDDDDLYDEAPELPDLDRLLGKDINVKNKAKPIDLPDSELSQKVLLSYLTSNPSLWTKVAPILKPEYFDKTFQQPLRWMQSFVDRYHKLPPKAIVQAETGLALDSPDDAGDRHMVEWMCDRTEEFCRHRAFENFLVASIEGIAKDRSRAAIAALVEQAKSITNISLHRDIGFEVHDAVPVLREAQKYDGISTGFRDLDHALDGGVTMPSMNLISGASGDGKSMMLMNIAVNYMLRGFNVIYYTMELEPSIVAKRFAAMMTGTAFRNIYTQLDQIELALRRRRDQEGRIFIKKFPQQGTSVADLRSHYHELHVVSNERWTVVCADYIDVMEPIRQVRNDNLHLRDKYIAEEFNAMAHDDDLPFIGWTASQQVKGAQDETPFDKEGRKKEGADRQSSVGGGSPKVHTCDNLMILKRRDVDKFNQRVWILMGKARSSGGKGKIIPIVWEEETGKWRDGPEEEYHDRNRYQPKGTMKHDPIMREAGFDGVNTPRPSGRSPGALKTIDIISSRLGS